jgi:uncharacterized oxidoreductase
MPTEEFTRRMEWLVAGVRSSAPAKGYSEVMVAGDPEWRAEAQRREHGIPLGDGTWQALSQLAGKLGVATLIDPLKEGL